MHRGLFRSTSIFSAMVFISRLLGFMRDMVIAYTFGATGTTDAFFVAFKIPNFMRRLFAEGAFSQAFVPVLVEYKQQRTQIQLQQYIDDTASVLMIVLLTLTFVGIIIAPLLITLFSPGFAHDSSRFVLATRMLRITLPYILLISLTAFAGSILNAYHRFAASAFTPVWLNLAVIASAIFLAPHLSQPIVALAWGVFIGGILQLGFQYPFLKHLQLVPSFQWRWRSVRLQRGLKFMLPAIFGVSTMQIGLLIDMMFASFLPQGSVSWLYNSERLIMFPLGVFGVALATVILPHLAKKFADKSVAEYSQTMNWAIQSVLLIGIPAAIGLMVLSAPLLISLFNYGHFNRFDVLMTQHALIGYAFGIPFMILVKVLVSGFYARQDIKTPVKIALLALLVNIVLNFMLIVPLKHAGLALATAVSALVNASLLFMLLLKDRIIKLQRGWWYFLIRCVIANVLMLLLICYLNSSITQWFVWHWQLRFLHLLMIILTAAVFYLLLLRLLGLQLFKGPLDANY